MSNNGSGFDFSGFEFDNFDFNNLSSGGSSGSKKSGKSGSFRFGGAEFNPYILNNFSLHYNDIHVDENTKFVVDISTHDDTGTEANGQLTYDIIGGADQRFFEIDARTGKVFFKQAPDFETPIDDGRDNEYEVKVRVTDAGGHTDTQILYVQVQDVFEDNAPEITSNGGGSTARVHVEENTTFVTNVQTTDDISSEANGQLVYSLNAGADQSLFTIDSKTGVLSFRNAPDFETPRDQGADNNYQVGVKVTDIAGNTDTQLITVDLKDVAENTAPEIISNGGGDSATVSILENTTFVTNVQTRDDFSSEENGELSYAITSGDDQDLFTIDENTGRLSFRNAPDFENPVGGDNHYSLHVTVTDAGGLTDTQTINVDVNNVDENTAPTIISNGGGDTATVTIPENSKFVTDVQTRDDSGTEGNGGLSYAITSGADQNLFEINESTGFLSFRNAPDFENPVGGDNRYSLHVTVTDAGGLSDTQTINVNVTDVNEVPPGKIIKGTEGDDTLVGMDGPDKIRGFGGKDTIKGMGGNDDIVGGRGDDLIGGGAGNDKINGTDSIGRGFNEFDVVSGNAGRDTFMLGDTSGSFYVGHGTQDLAAILDFDLGEDTLVLYGSASDYTLETSNFGTAIVRSANGRTPDIIANIKDVSASSIDLDQFTYIH